MTNRTQCNGHNLASSICNDKPSNNIDYEPHVGLPAQVASAHSYTRMHEHRLHHRLDNGRSPLTISHNPHARDPIQQSKCKQPTPTAKVSKQPTAIGCAPYITTCTRPIECCNEKLVCTYTASCSKLIIRLCALTTVLISPVFCFRIFCMKNCRSETRFSAMTEHPQRQSAAREAKE